MGRKKGDLLRLHGTQLDINDGIFNVIEKLHSQVVDLRHRVLAHEFALSVVVLSGERDENLARLRAVKAGVEEAKEEAKNADSGSEPIAAVIDVLERLEKFLEKASDNAAPSS